MNARRVFTMNADGSHSITVPSVERITSRANAVAAARADEVRSELAALAEHMRRSLGQHARHHAKIVFAARRSSTP